MRFGKLATYQLDGVAYASPLYVASVNIPGQGFHNVVYVATEHDSVYAFDADGVGPTPLWQVSFVNPPTITTVPATDTGEPNDIAPEIGIITCWRVVALYPRTQPCQGALSPCAAAAI